VFARLQLLIRKLVGSLAYLPRVVALLWRDAGLWPLAWVTLLTAQGILPAATVYFTKSLVDSLVEAVGGAQDEARVRPLLFYAALLGILLLLTELLRGLTSFVRAAQAELLKDHISSLIQNKSVSIDYAFYELPDYHDHLHRARSDASDRSMVLLESVGSLFRDMLTLAAMLIVLVPFGWWLPLLLLAATVPSVLVVLLYTLRRYSWERGMTEAERRSSYYDWVLTASETAAEVRLFGLGDYFQGVFRRLRGKLRGERFEMAWKQSLAELGAVFLAMGTTGGVLAWMGWQALLGAVSLGMLALFYQAFNQGQQLLRSLLGNFSALYINGLFLSDLFEFLDLQPRVVNPAAPSPAPVALREGIRFSHVTFHYPGSERAALDNFNLKIPAGKITAIVGINGAGKSTLIKLLCRLYDPDEGSITIDGVDLRQLSLDDLRRSMTVLFQEPVHYNATVTENIRLGTWAQEASNGCAVDEQMRAAAKSAGAAEMISRLPDDYETMLGKWFSQGAELSTGEWQRLALARAFFREAPIVLLDEPTSAMDSWAESDWLRRFRQSMVGRTVMIITHRFTTAMHADQIQVVVGGRVVESGAHQELCASGGLYAQSWLAQMEAGDQCKSQ
jgi:ATP-binding cassette subfamily B protein